MMPLGCGEREAWDGYDGGRQHANLAMVVLAVFSLCVRKVKITRRCRVENFNIKYTHPGRRVREASKNVVPAEHAPTSVEVLFVCRRAGRRDVVGATLNVQ